MNLQADFEQAEGVAVLAVLDDVLPDARQQRGAHQRLVGGDGVGHAHVRRRIEAEGARGFFAEERVVVDFGETLVHEDVAHFVLELALGVGGRHGRRAPAAPAARWNRSPPCGRLLPPGRP